MPRFCYALDLKPDPQLIAAYEAHHRAVWPEVLESLRQAGIREMQIYRVANRLFMIMETDEHFDAAAKARADAANETVQQWEQLMWTYQQALPRAAPGEKWRPMHCLFDWAATTPAKDNPADSPTLKP